MGKQPNPAAIERIKASRNKSLQLMQLDSHGKLDNIVKGKRGDISESLTEGSTTTTASMMSRHPQQYKATSPTMMPQSAKNLPKEIIESFAKNPIDTSSLAFGEMSDMSMLTEGMEPVQRIAESSYCETPSVQTPSYGGQIDYPMIRTIVEDVVRKYAQSLNKRILGEGKGGQLNEVNSIVLGKTFKFLAKNGDIYEAKLTKIGNINEKRNK